MTDTRRRQIEKKIMFLLHNAGMQNSADRHERDKFVHELDSQTNGLKDSAQSSSVLAEILNKQSAELNGYYEQYKNFSAEDFLNLDMSSFDYLQKKVVLRQFESASLELSPDKLREYAELAVDSGFKSFILELIPKKEKFLAHLQAQNSGG
jgi:tRNA splicing endonuclease